MGRQNLMRPTDTHDANLLAPACCRLAGSASAAPACVPPESRAPMTDAAASRCSAGRTHQAPAGDAQVRDDSSSASRRAKQNDATAQPCPARPSRACLASRTNRVPVVTRIGGRGDGAAVDDGPGCRRRADAAALSSRGRDIGGRGPKRRVLRQADGGRAQTSLSWLADTLLSQDRAAPIRFCRPTPPPEWDEDDLPAPECLASLETYDLSVVRRQEHVKRALEVAASGGHNLMMQGPPGSGKTLLGRS